MRGVFGKASSHRSEELRQGWRSLKILCRFGNMGLYVTTKGVLVMSCGSLFSLSASPLEIDVAFSMASFMDLLLYPLCRRCAFGRESHWSIFFVGIGQGCKGGSFSYVLDSSLCSKDVGACQWAYCTNPLLVVSFLR